MLIPAKKNARSPWSGSAISRQKALSTSQSGCFPTSAPLPQSLYVWVGVAMGLGEVRTWRSATNDWYLKHLFRLYIIR